MKENYLQNNKDNINILDKDIQKISKEIFKKHSDIKNIIINSNYFYFSSKIIYDSNISIQLKGEIYHKDDDLVKNYVNKVFLLKNI